MKLPKLPAVLTPSVAALCLLLAVAGVRAEGNDATPLARVTPEEALTIDALITTVNGEPVFVKDIIRPLDADFRRMGAPGGSTSLRDFKEKVFDKLHVQLQATVGEIMFYSVAKDALGDEQIKTVDMIMNRKERDLLAKYKGSRAMADEDLRARGTSVDKELQVMRREVMVDFYKQKTVYPKINVRRQDVLDEYEKRIDEFTIVPEVDLYQISVGVKRFLVKPAARGGDPVPNLTPTADEIRAAESQAMALAQQIHDRLQKGEDFAKLAAEFSDDPYAQNGGRMAHLHRNTLMHTDVENKAFSMKSNTLAEPFFSPDKDPTKAWAVVLKVGEVVEGRVRSFDEVQQKLDSELRQKQYTELLNTYYKKLYNQAAIDNKERIETILTTATNVVVARYAVK